MKGSDFILSLKYFVTAFLGCIPLFVKVFLLIYIVGVFYMLSIKKKFDVLNREIIEDVCKSLNENLPNPNIRKDVFLKYQSVSNRYRYVNAALHRLGFLSSMFMMFNSVAKEVDLLSVFASGTVCMIVLNIFYYFAEYRTRKSSLVQNL